MIAIECLNKDNQIVSLKYDLDQYVLYDHDDVAIFPLYSQKRIEEPKVLEAYAVDQFDDQSIVQCLQTDDLIYVDKLVEELTEHEKSWVKQCYTRVLKKYEFRRNKVIVVPVKDVDYSQPLEIVNNVQRRVGCTISTLIQHDDSVAGFRDDVVSSAMTLTLGSTYQQTIDIDITCSNILDSIRFNESLFGDVLVSAFKPNEWTVDDNWTFGITLGSIVKLTGLVPHKLTLNGVDLQLPLPYWDQLM